MTKHTNAHTENAYDILTPTNLSRYRFVTFLERAPFGLKNVDTCIMHCINDVTQPVDISHRQEVE
jgi:hypothetical protein